jgi:hypothetical protein
MAVRNVAGLLAGAADLAAVDAADVQRRVRRLRDVIADRRRYVEVLP